MKKRVFSGVKPSARLHIGNYIGAIRNWVADLEARENIFCVVDLHAITVDHDPEELRTLTRELVGLYIACGLDPQKAHIFVQSHIPEHTELAWLFNCVTPMGWLERMTQFKDKAGTQRERVSTGLFTYPTLMAADILAYKATHVPVGDDQKQHLELTRDIAQAFNAMFGEEFFPLPEPQILGSATRVMSLRDGTAKMSKSDPSEYSRITLFDDADAIMAKIRKAKTDPEPLPSEAEGLAGRPEAQNLVSIYAALANRDEADVLAEFGGQGFGAFKPALADLAISQLEPITSRMQALMDAPDHIDGILANGAERAHEISAPIMADIRRLTGFLGKSLG